MIAMSDAMKLSLLAVLTELLTGCPPRPPVGSPPVGSCPADASGHGTATAVSALDRGGPGCPEWGCGTNSPTIGDGIVFDELDSSQTLEDAHGIKIKTAILDDGDAVDLHVTRDLLSANRRSNSQPLTNDELKRLTITLAIRRVATGDYFEFELRIAEINMQILGFWAGRREQVPAYLINARQTVPPGPPQFVPVCKITATSVTEPDWQDSEHYALIFTGDRYHPTTKTVDDAPAGTTWFNLACAATAPAKMHLMRHTNAGAGTDRAYATTVSERNAMLKMFTADYCGDGNNTAVDGTMYTVDGQRLLYGDSRNWYTPPAGVPLFSVNSSSGVLSPAGTTIEALWTERGATCLTRPRLSSRSNVRCAATIAPCNPEQIAHWTASNHVISVNEPCTP
jgi:ADYC domain